MAKKKDLRIYPAVLYKDGDGYSVYYPDLPGCLTCGDDLEEALSNAREALEGFLYVSEVDNDPVSPPTPVEDLHLPEGHFPTLISVRMDIVREEEAQRSITKTVTIPAWMDKLGREANVNFSKVLQEGLRDRLQV